MKAYTCVETFVHDRRAYVKGQGPVWFQDSTGDALERKQLLIEYCGPTVTVPPASTTFVCLASGPSLTAEDCELVKASGHVAIAVNLTFRRAPWAHYLYGMDHDFWRQYGKETASFKGRKVAPHHIPDTEYRHIVAGNSGAGAILLAVEQGAKRVILLGYDCQMTEGKAHWHEDYPKTMGNAGSSKKWPAQFAAVAKAMPDGVEVINATRDTALKLWPRVALEDAFRLS